MKVCLNKLLILGSIVDLQNALGGGALQYQMDTGVRLTLPKAGAFGENTISKNEGSLGEKPNCGSKLGVIG